VPEALIKFTAAGHIRFGIAGDSDGDLSEDLYGEYLPVIVVPISAGAAYYRKFFVENIDTVPFYNWKLKVTSNQDEISAKIAYEQNPQNRIYNSQKPPAGISDADWKDEVAGKDFDLPLFEPNKPLCFWLKLEAQPDVERYSTYTITLTFEGYS